MNLQPAKKHESVSIVLVPFDQYAPFPDAVDALLRFTRAPFELIVVEGNAPESVRHKLEQRQKKHKNIRIIYSDRKVGMAEAFNLGLPHVRTRTAFLTHNSVRVTANWLENLLGQHREASGVVCPYVSSAENMRREKNLPEVDLHGFFVSKETMRLLGELDAKIAAPLIGIELGQLLKKHGLAVHRDPFTVLEFNSPKISDSSDMKFFQHQWDEKRTRESVAYLNKKWGLNLQASRYMKTPARDAVSAWREHTFQIQSPKLSFKKFLQVLNKA